MKSSFMIHGKTRISGIIGDPIEHTVSPAMQNAAFQELGLDYVYVPFRVRKEDLNQAIQGVRALNIRGLNVTIPHKVAIIPLLDEQDSVVANLGAVNTIVNENGILRGYNTDALGFLKALLAEQVPPARKNVVILGSGGAARAIAFFLADQSANITIVNRHAEPAQQIANRMLGLFRRAIKVCELTRENLRKVLREADILVNATNVGMTPDVDTSLVPAELLKSGLLVFDIIYNPLKTRLLRDAEQQGARVISGVEMLIYQGAAAFELWTGRKAPVEVMRKAALEALNSHEE
jgi:shikimate dehydrogenase